jgi:hypothetical protein
MSDMKEDRQISGSSANTGSIELPIGSRDILNQHDTPPPTLFMQGSCILEFGLFAADELRRIVSFDSFENFLHEKEATRGAPDPSSLRIAHIKIVDGSGEMLYRFDNNQDEVVTIGMVLGDLGSLTYRLNHVGHLLDLPANTKIDLKNGDPPMNDGRVRLRCLDAGSSNDIDISGIRIEKQTNAGAVPVYFGNFRDLNSEGTELKIMVWYHEMR